MRLQSHDELFDARHPETNVVRLRSPGEEIDVDSQRGFSVVCCHGLSQNK